MLTTHLHIVAPCGLTQQQARDWVNDWSSPLVPGRRYVVYYSYSTPEGLPATAEMKVDENGNVTFPPC